MKNIILTSAFLLVIMVQSHETRAQAYWGGSINLSTPTGDFRESFTAGLGLQGDLFFDLNDFAFAQVSLGYNRLFPKDNASNFAYSQVPLTVSGYYTLAENYTRPYIGGGLGVYRKSATMTIVGTTTTEARFEAGVHLAAGMMINDKFNTALKYHILSGDAAFTTNYLELTFGLVFNR